MDGIEFAVVDTLQHRLARDAEQLSGFLHGHVPCRGLLDKAIAQLLGDTDLPGRARRDLLAGNEAIVEPSVQGRWGDVEDLGRLFDAHQLALG